MRAWPTALLAHLATENPTTAICWEVERRDGVVIRGTEHDRDLTAPAGPDANGADGVPFRAAAQISATQLHQSSDLSVDNMEVAGAIPSENTTVVDVDVQAIEAGLLRQAAVRIWIVNWRDLTMGAGLAKRGFLGDIERTSDGAYTAEFRGLIQRLQQTIGRTYGVDCEVREFGDAECKVDVPALTASGTVTAVHSRRRFDSNLSSIEAAGFYSLGVVTFTSGANAGFEREVKRDDEGDVVGNLSVWDPLPAAIEVGDTFTLAPGCDRRASTCRDKYSNLLNFRGYGIFVEGLDALMAGPT